MFTHRPDPAPFQLTQQEREEQNMHAWVQGTLASMSAEEKIGQLIMWHIDEKELSSESAQLLTDIPFGGVIIMGNHTKESLKKLTDQIQAIPSRIPRFIAIDQEGGKVIRLTDDPNPGPKILADKTDDEICEVYRNTTKLLKQAGVNMNFGIVADTGWYDNGYISERTFGKGPESVARLTRLAVECSKAPGFLVTLKHFPGHGRTKLDSHKEIPVIKTPYNEWKDTDALPFQTGIDAGADVVMLGHLTYEQIATEPASLSDRWTTELRDMGFEGLIITDDMGMMEKTESLNNFLEDSTFLSSDIVLFVSSKQKPADIIEKIKNIYKKEDLLKNTLNKKIPRILKSKYSLQH